MGKLRKSRRSPYFEDSSVEDFYYKPDKLRNAIIFIIMTIMTALSIIISKRHSTKIIRVLSNFPMTSLIWIWRNCYCCCWLVWISLNAAVVRYETRWKITGSGKSWLFILNNSNYRKNRTTLFKCAAVV